MTKTSHLHFVMGVAHRVVHPVSGKLTQPKPQLLIFPCRGFGILFVILISLVGLLSRFYQCLLVYRIYGNALNI